MSLPEEGETRVILFPRRDIQRKGHVRTQPEGESLQGRKRGLTETSPVADTLVLYAATQVAVPCFGSPRSQCRGVCYDGSGRLELLCVLQVRLAGAGNLPRPWRYRPWNTLRDHELAEKSLYKRILRMEPPGDFL